MVLNFKKNTILLAKVIQIYHQKGTHYLLKMFFSYIIERLEKSFEYFYYKIFKSRTFTYCGQSYNYFYHMYNYTWRNERAVEIPILWEIVKNTKGNILEVGNVLSHYFPVKHDVIDKYEKAPNVINLDVVDLDSSKKYNLIVSISTLEHVGWDEKPREPKKIVYALRKLKECLNPGGKIVLTLPLGYNKEVDKLLEEKKNTFYRTALSQTNFL